VAAELTGEGKAPALPLGINLPENETHILRLLAKREEYETRLSGEAYRAPDSPQGAYDKYLKYSILILNTLFVEGSVTTKAVMDELSTEPNFDEWEAEEAIRIVHDYCETGGATLVGGTGLPEVGAEPVV
jgi:hypothetical protein